jgi:hypothetical protein
MLDYLDKAGDLVRAQPEFVLGVAIAVLMGLALILGALERRKARRRAAEKRRAEDDRRQSA